MVILAMHVVCHRTAERDELCSGCYRKKPAHRQGDTDQLSERQAGFCNDRAGLPVRRQKAIHAGHDEHMIRYGQTRIAIAASAAVSKRWNRLPEFRERRRHIFLPMDRMTVLRESRKPAPRSQCSVGHAATQNTSPNSTPTTR